MSRVHRLREHIELSRSWTVLDALRPITRADFEASERADDGAESVLAPPGAAPVESSAHFGVPGCEACDTARRLRCP